MTLIRTGAGLSSIRGSIAGATFSRSKAGSFSRSKTKPVNPSSANQQNARSILKVLNNAWTADLTAAQRAAWNNYAAHIVTLNRLGEPVHLTGFLHFVGSNEARLIAGLSQVSSAPEVLVLPGADHSFVVDMSPDLQQLLVTFDTSKDWVTETGAALSIKLGRSIPAARTTYHGPWTHLSQILGNASTPPTSPHVITGLPHPIGSNQKIWVQYRILRADGRLSNPLIAEMSVVAGLLLVVNDYNTHELFLTTLSASVIKEYDQNKQYEHLHVDPITHNIWVSTYPNDYLYMFHLEGNSVVVDSYHQIDYSPISLEGVCADPRGTYLYACNDQDGANTRLLKCLRTLNESSKYPVDTAFDISSFSTSPQDVTFDTSDNTLWLTDNIAKKIFHVSPDTGEELSGTLDVYALGYDLGTGLMGVDYDASDDTLWFCSRSKKIFHIQKNGTQIAELESPTASSGPTGVCVAH